MVNIEKMNGNERFIQCSSCMKSSEQIDIYKIKVGKTMRQTSILKLCYECLKDLNEQIYQQTTGFIDEEKQ